ncbi:MAG TPA: MarR family transcriptional regulator [Polyangiaceae bacterium]|nr:MarR family transcriptional regulator [Polyangiaceae bacterium]
MEGVHAWQRRQRAALKPLGLTHSQFVLLATATWFGATEKLTQARLAELAGIDVMTTSQVVRTLEGSALMERCEHPDDPRAKSIRVTARGRELAQQAVVVVEQTDAAFFEPLGERTERLVQLFDVLVKSEAEKA